MKRQIILALIATLLALGTAEAKSGNVDNGKTIYSKRCVHCHGVDGDGLAPAEERLNPPPRDFTSGMFKIKSSAFDDAVANDDDIYRMIKDGMPGTAMPGWADVVSDQDMWDLVAYVKTFAEMGDAKASKQIDYGSQISSSEDSIKKGQELFLDRCAECHGELGRGDANKKLKDDLGYRTWPRNLTKAWTFRGSNDPKDIFTRMSVGIPGTQMPSFADPNSKKKMSVEERWHVANFVASLEEKEKSVQSENTVVKAERIEGALPTTVDDEAWNVSQPTTFYMLPQLILKERFFKYANDTVTARALYNDKEIAFLVEWDDRTKSVPGDEKGALLADGEVYNDAMAMQFPVEVLGSEKPYFVYGDGAKPVNLWKWQSESVEAPQKVSLINASGFETQEVRDAAETGLTGTAVYNKGTWRLIMKRALVTSKADKDIQFEEGKFTPLAFMAWDGTNGENGTKHTITTWYWLLLKPSASANVYIVPIIVMLIVFGAEALWARSASRKKS